MKSQTGQVFKSAGYGWKTIDIDETRIYCDRPNTLFLEDGTVVNLTAIAKKESIMKLMGYKAKNKADLKDFEQYVIPPK
jgi:hypothetical protein